jgi:hypothetical protein
MISYLFLSFIGFLFTIIKPNIIKKPPKIKNIVIFSFNSKNERDVDKIGIK